MKDYFFLQFRMFNRRLADFGLPPYLAYPIALVAFVLLSNYSFERTDLAGYIYVLFPLSLLGVLADCKRNDFLRSIFRDAAYFRLRIMENLMVCLPFLLVLAYHKLFLLVLLLFGVGVSMVFLSTPSAANVTIPTPFGRKPFEFPAGYRKTFFLFPLAYFLTFKAVRSNNLNLGIFAMILIGLVCASYYAKPENEFFVWNFIGSPKEFLFEKIKVCFGYFILLNVPIVIVLLIFFTGHFLNVVTFLLAIFIYLATMVLAKYSAYPHAVNLPQLALMGICVLFPPLLLVIIPLFFFQSIKNLNPILDDND